MANKIKKIQLVKDGVTEEFDIAGGSGGTSDYTDLENKPQINSVELDGNKTIEDLDLISSDAGNGLKIGEDGKLVADVQKGILSEGTVKGVRCTTLTQGSTASGYKEVKFTYKDGDENLIDSDGRLTAPEDGLYFYRIRPANFHSISKAQTIIIQLNNPVVSTADNNDSQIDYRFTQTSERPVTISGVVKLNKGDIIYTFYSISQTFSNDQVAAEFYKINERTDGLVAEAKYANQTFAKDATKTIELIEATDTNVFPGNGQIVLPEDGSYIISADMTNGTNSVTSHTVRTYLHEGSTSGATLSFNTMPAAATVATMNITHVVQGKKGDVFVIAALHDSYAYNYVRKATDDVSGVRLFKMSFTGTGGGGTGGVTQEELDEQLALKQDVLTAGEHITIDKDGVISASGARGLRGLTGPEGIADLNYNYNSVEQTLTISADNTRRDTNAYIMDPRKTTATGIVTSTFTAKRPCTVVPFFMSANAYSEGSHASAAVTYECTDPEYLAEHEFLQTDSYGAYMNARVYRINEGETITVEGSVTKGNSKCTSISAIVVIEEEDSLGELDYEFKKAYKVSNSANNSYVHTLEDDDMYLLQVMSAGGGTYSPSVPNFTTDNPDRFFYGNSEIMHLGNNEVPKSYGSTLCVSNNSYKGYAGIALYDLQGRSEDETLTTTTTITNSTGTYTDSMWLVAKRKQDKS